jgi:Uncharacterized conserved protein
MTRTAVSLLRHDTYDPDKTLAALKKLLEPLGGMAAFVKTGDSVVLKPNLVFGRSENKAVNTHHAIVRAVAVLADEAGAGKIVIGDSPGYGSARMAARHCGILSAADELGIEVIEFTPREHIDQNRFFPRLELADELLKADCIINLPKLKTHGQMLMSMAVKNMFGAVPGARKFQWHYRAGRDKIFFARMLNDIALAVRPTLSIMDAVLAMDGKGPGSGRARPANFLAAGADPWCMDAILMDVLGLERKLLFTLAEMEQRGHDWWHGATAVGPEPSVLRPNDWDIPELITTQMHGKFIEKHLPSVAAWMRERITPPPFPKKSCTKCGYCINICPVKAIRGIDGGIAIDSKTCIRCYCCHELCQHDGMDMARGGLLARILGIK